MDWHQERGQATDDLEESGDTEEQQRELFYPNVDQFVDGYLTRTYREEFTVAGRGTGFTWCAQRRRHSEAVNRLTALW